MRRSIVPNSSLIPDAFINTSCIRMEPVAPCTHEMMPIPDHVSPHHPAANKIEGVSSLETALKIFWDDQRQKLQNFTGFDRHNHLPLTRVRKILKSDPDVRMISWDTPALFSIACEYFILELTLRAWMHTQSCSRLTIHRCDIFQAIKKSEIYGFLIDLVPFGPHCAMHQGALPPPEMVLPDMNVPLDMNQIPQENLISEPFRNNDKGFDLNVNLQDCTCGFGFCSEHDSAGSCSARET